MKTVLGLILCVPLLCAAQTYKCQINGKWEYQAHPCTSAPSQSVDTRPSTEGMTGLRTDANRMAAKERAQAAQEQRAAAAKAQAQDERRARAREEAKHRELVNAINNKSNAPTYNCRPDGFGGSTCKPR